MTSSYQITDEEKEHVIGMLDIGYARNEPLQQFVAQMIEKGVPQNIRNAIVLASDYGQDDKIRSTITLFGGGDE